MVLPVRSTCSGPQPVSSRVALSATPVSQFFIANARI